MKIFLWQYRSSFPGGAEAGDADTKEEEGEGGSSHQERKAGASGQGAEEEGTTSQSVRGGGSEERREKIEYFSEIMNSRLWWSQNFCFRQDRSMTGISYEILNLEIIFSQVIIYCVLNIDIWVLIF